MCKYLYTEHNKHAYDLIVFTNSCFRRSHKDGNGIVFKNVRFENRFQKFVFSGFQIDIVM